MAEGAECGHSLAGIFIECPMTECVRQFKVCLFNVSCTTLVSLHLARPRSNQNYFLPIGL
jgi:hypothetical protein